MTKYVKTFENFNADLGAVKGTLKGDEKIKDEKANDVGTLQTKTYSFDMPQDEEIAPTPEQYEKEKENGTWPTCWESSRTGRERKSEPERTRAGRAVRRAAG